MEKKILFEILEKHYVEILDSLQIDCMSTFYKLIAYEIMMMLFEDDGGKIVDLVKESRRGVLRIMISARRDKSPVFDLCAIGRVLLKFDDLIDEIKERERA